MKIVGIRRGDWNGVQAFIDVEVEGFLIRNIRHVVKDGNDFFTGKGHKDKTDQWQNDLWLSAEAQVELRSLMETYEEEE